MAARKPIRKVYASWADLPAPGDQAERLDLAHEDMHGVAVDIRTLADGTRLLRPPLVRSSGPDGEIRESRMVAAAWFQIVSRNAPTKRHIGKIERSDIDLLREGIMPADLLMNEDET